MSVMQAPQDRGASPLMSNNPFRNRIASTQPQPARPISTNPFLDSTELPKQPTATIKPVPVDPVDSAADIFGSMDMNGTSRSPDRSQRPGTSGRASRPDNAPPRPMRGPPPSHRPLSEEERRHQGGPVRRGGELDIFADPTETSKNRERRPGQPRRNSESSVRDKTGSLETEEDRKRRDRKSRDPRTGKQKSSKKLDVIDKLDVTSIYGTGLFHHDGPFDACNPNRNKKRHRMAPMLAFPKDSANMQLGGSGPVNRQMDYDKFHGYGQEAHIDYNEAAVVEEEPADVSRRPLPERSTSFNPTDRVDPIHSQETAGLGTSTFLEGAPASKAAMERRDSEYENGQQVVGGSLSRKKSLAQKIRGVRGGGNRVQSPDLDRAPTSPLATGRSDSAVNPFFKDYDQEYEKKGQQIAFAEQQNNVNRTRAPSSPRRPVGLERQMTGESVEGAQEGKPSGFLGRMKSLKKTKSRPERRDAS